MTQYGDIDLNNVKLIHIMDATFRIDAVNSQTINKDIQKWAGTLKNYLEHKTCLKTQKKLM